MTGQEITIEQLRRHVYARRCKICFIIAAVMVLATLVLVALFVGDVLDWEENLAWFPLTIVCPTVAVSCVLAAISLICSDSKDRKNFEAEIAALGGPDALMSEVYYETLYVLSRCGEPYTIITRRHIIEVGYHIYPIAGIARVTKWTYSKSPFRMRLYYYGNGSERWEFARVGILRHAEYMNILQAILSVNPYVVMQ